MDIGEGYRLDLEKGDSDILRTKGGVYSISVKNSQGRTIIILMHYNFLSLLAKTFQELRVHG